MVRAVSVTDTKIQTKNCNVCEDVKRARLLYRPLTIKHIKNIINTKNVDGITNKTYPSTNEN